jgi:hypothetical protein
MYKALCVVVLLLPTFALTQARSSAVTPVSPPIVAKGKLLNQTAPIPTTTIFTPTQTGLYRLSVYGTITISTCSGSFWSFNPGWTDDSGVLSTENQILFSNGDCLGPFNWSSIGTIGLTMVIEAKAGTAITYNVTQNGSPDGSAYSIYYALERLE